MFSFSFKIVKNAENVSWNIRKQNSIAIMSNQLFIFPTSMHNITSLHSVSLLSSFGLWTWVNDQQLCWTLGLCFFQPNVPDSLLCSVCLKQTLLNTGCSGYECMTLNKASHCRASLIFNVNRIKQSRTTSWENYCTLRLATYEGCVKRPAWNVNSGVLE